MEISKERLYQMSLFTIGGFSFVGFVIIQFLTPHEVLEILLGGDSYVWQFITGTSFGVYAAMMAILIIRFTPLKDVKDFYSKMFSGLKLNFPDILFYSLCAGIGEEILFRGAVQTLAVNWPQVASQPHLGIWIVSLVFVALHGYINPKDIKLSIYAFFLVVVSAGMGYLYHYYGLISAIISHVIFDLVMFGYLIYQQRVGEL